MVRPRRRPKKTCETKFCAMDMTATDRGSIERPNKRIAVAILCGSDRSFGFNDRVDPSDLRTMSVVTNPISSLATFTSIGSLCGYLKEQMVSNVAAHRLGIRGDLVLDGAIDLRCRHRREGVEVSAIQ